MAANDIDRLYAAILALPVPERQRLVERVVQDASGVRGPGEKPAKQPTLLGLMADEPDLVDQAWNCIREARTSARLRSMDE